MTDIFARKALLPNGWTDNVRLEVRAGRVRRLTANESPKPEDFVAGIVIPGLANAHSHAFQRALAGRTEERAAAGRDNFWTWRERMYDLAGRIDATTLCAIAAQAYSEMLASGYTSVAEFHYLHRERGGDAGDDMFHALCKAAEQSGIRLTYVPVLYERAGFDRPEPSGQQKLFALDTAEFFDHYSRAARSTGERLNIGIGAHSLRAVSAGSLSEIERLAVDAQVPLHLHIAEQQREVDECLSTYGSRPVHWLLDNFDVGDRWCLVHATHMDTDETAALAESGAVVCLCPSTEANLGDGLFPLKAFLQRDGRIAIGSDSHISINPFEELRWLEYGQRLSSQSRNVAAIGEPHVGHELFSRALAGGARACAQKPAGLEAGAAADLVVLDAEDPMLVGHDDASLLDALVFSGYRLPIERVMVHGDWRIIDGAHVAEDDLRGAFASAQQRIGAGQ